MTKSKRPASNPGDYEKLKKKLAIEEGKSLIKAYPDYPVDDKGQRISDKKTGETMKPMAGKDLKNGRKEIGDIQRLVKSDGSKPKDWVKLSSNSRDVNDGIKDNKPKKWEVHGYKNLTSGQVKDLKAVDLNKRSAENKATSQKKAIMDKPTGKSGLPQKGELTNQFNKNAQDATAKKTETKAETPKKQDFAKKAELPQKGELTRKFNENAADITKKHTEKRGDPPPKAELKPKPDKPKFG